MHDLLDNLRGASLSAPGVALLAITVVMTVFGAVMIYSASSIIALTQEISHFDSTYYLKRQLIAVGIGLAMGLVTWRLDYHVWTQALFPYVWTGTVVLLLIVIATSAGSEAYGATRWIRLGPISIQPSEFAKATMLVTAASLIHQYFEERSITLTELGARAGLLVAIPLILVLKQPDKGTVIVIGLTIVLMLFLAGMPLQIVGILALVGFTFMLVMALKDDYSRQRVFTMFNPWLDPYGSGYQLIQGFYAFATGGLFGVGIGNSHQKYSYLPMAYNDFIFAVTGEELGLVGTLSVLAAFLLLVWLGFRIARNAPDLHGKLIAAGSMTMLAIQMLVNVCGVLAMIPLSGKPIPFLSYGGSSIMSTLLIVGLALNVASSSPAHRVRKRNFAVVEGASLRRGMRVYEGGGRSDSVGRRTTGSSGRGRVSYNRSGSQRIDLGPSARERLRR